MQTFAKKPNHIGFIMDGNGRWAVQNQKERFWGHKRGVEATKRVAEAVLLYEIPYASLYAFSTENWLRPKLEVTFLMELLELHLRRERNFYQTNDIRVVVSGAREDLPKGVVSAIEDIESCTEHNTSLIANLLINHGGRGEIVRAANRWIAENPGEPLSEESLSSHLDQPNFPSLDLLVRSGGESRISNFMLWHAAYAELYFSEEMWPEWGQEALEKAFAFYNDRERRFGGVEAK